MLCWRTRPSEACSQRRSPVRLSSSSLKCCVQGLWLSWRPTSPRTGTCAAPLTRYSCSQSRMLPWAPSPCNCPQANLRGSCTCCTQALGCPTGRRTFVVATQLGVQQPARGLPSAVGLAMQTLCTSACAWLTHLLHAGFGLPNRRRRVFIVASMDADARDILLSKVHTSICAYPHWHSAPLQLCAHSACGCCVLWHQRGVALRKVGC